MIITIIGIIGIIGIRNASTFWLSLQEAMMLLQMPLQSQYFSSCANPQTKIPHGKNQNRNREADPAREHGAAGRACVGVQRHRHQTVDAEVELQLHGPPEPRLPSTERVAVLDAVKVKLDFDCSG